MCDVQPAGGEAEGAGLLRSVSQPADAGVHAEAEGVVSGEFSWSDGGYMHTTLARHAEDCSRDEFEEAANPEIVRLFGAILSALQPIARGICWERAGDSRMDAPIGAAIKQCPELKQAVDALDWYLGPFRDLQEKAIREALEEDPVELKFRLRQDAPLG